MAELRRPTCGTQQHRFHVDAQSELASTRERFPPCQPSDASHGRRARNGASRPWLARRNMIYPLHLVIGSKSASAITRFVHKGASCRRSRFRVALTSPLPTPLRLVQCDQDTPVQPSSSSRTPGWPRLRHRKPCRARQARSCRHAQGLSRRRPAPPRAQAGEAPGWATQDCQSDSRG